MDKSSLLNELLLRRKLLLRFLKPHFYPGVRTKIHFLENWSAFETSNIKSCLVGKFKTMR